MRAVIYINYHHTLRHLLHHFSDRIRCVKVQLPMLIHEWVQAAIQTVIRVQQ